MSTHESSSVAYVKYYGASVEDGIMGAKESAEALLGLDEFVKYFLSKECPELPSDKIELPVQVKKGSWHVDLLDYVLNNKGQVIATAFTTNLAIQSAKEGLLETGPVKDLKKVFKGAVTAAKWVIKIAKHRKTMAKEGLKDQVSVDGENIAISSDENGILLVPLKFYDLYEACPEEVFSKTASLIESQRELEIGTSEDKDEPVQITAQEKMIFYREAKEKEIVLPELVHGEWVELEGEITRVNENSNSMGFRYNNHVLTCKPSSGHIVTFKSKAISKASNHFFPSVKLVGEVNRQDKNGAFKYKKPQIMFSDIVPVEAVTEEPTLF